MCIHIKYLCNRTPISLGQTGHFDGCFFFKNLEDGVNVRTPCFGFRVKGFGIRVTGSGLRVKGFGFRVESYGFRVKEFGLRVNQGSRVQG